MQCTLAIAGCRSLVARVTTSPVLGLAGEDRRQVAVAAREAIGVGAGLGRHGMVSAL
jgi:1-acyl-sn-glycerol-3-phosphate acyltransferase